MERWNRLHPGPSRRARRTSSQALAGAEGPIVAATDYMKVVADQVAPWLPGRMETLGTDGFGRSDNREHLRRHFEVNAESIAAAALSRLARDGQFDGRRAGAMAALRARSAAWIPERRRSLRRAVTTALKPHANWPTRRRRRDGRSAGALALIKIVAGSGGPFHGGGGGRPGIRRRRVRFRLRAAGLTLAAKPADWNHPYGHGRVEILTGLLIGLVLTAGGALISLRLARAPGPAARAAGGFRGLAAGRFAGGQDRPGQLQVPLRAQD